MANALYQRWLQLLEKCPSERAVVDGCNGHSWTFAQLAKRADTIPAEAPNSLRVLQGHQVDYILQTLAAWRDDAIVLPSEKALEPADLPAISPDRGRHIKRTSGAEGTPRWIAFQPEHLLADVDNIVHTMPLQRSWPNVGIISLSHSYGFSNLVLPLLIHGIPLILLPDPLPATIRRCLAEHTQVTLPAVPAMWRAWLRAGVLSPSIQLAISAGAPLSLQLETEVFERFGIKIHNFYGSSECGGIAYDGSDQPRLHPSDVGYPVRGVRLSLTDNNRLIVSSKAVAEGYLCARPEDNLGNGQFTTPDLAKLNPDGRVTLLGNTGDSINVAGRKISPRVVEDALKTQAGIKEAVVFGVPSTDAERVEEIVAAITTDDGIDLRALKISLKNQLATWQQPRLWWHYNSAKTAKKHLNSRAEWRAAYLDEHGR